MVTVSWSLQRAEHGEQPVWLGLVLAAMLGQIGLPGGRIRPRVRINRRRRATPARCPRRVCLRARTASTPASRWPGSRTCCCIPAPHTTTTGSAAATRTSSLSTGAAGTRSTTTRTSPGCVRRSPGRTPWWCMTRSGPPPRGTRTSSCPRRCRSNATISAPVATTPLCSPCRSWPNRMPRRAMTMPPSPP